MTLAELFVQTFFAADGLDVGLRHNGHELTAPGYKRCKVTDWTADGGEARGTGSWGPFGQPVQWDSLGLYYRDELVDVIPVGPTSVPSDTTWTQPVVVTGG